MTKKERVLSAINNNNQDKDTLNALIAFAYYMGREESAIEICTKIYKQIEEQKERAKKCRYNKMARKVIGNIDVYDTDYRQDYITHFGEDETTY